MAVCISKITDIEKIISELQVFQNRIGTHRITEILKYVLRGIEGDKFRVFVDAWPDWDFLLVEHKIADGTQGSGFASSMSVWAKTGTGLCNAFKNNKNLVSVGRALAVETEQAKDFHDGVSHWGKQVKFLNPLAIFDINTETIPGGYLEKYTSIPYGFKLDTLRADDIEKIHGLWSSAESCPQSLLKEAINHLPSACVRDQSGRCVSWGLILFDAEISHLFTLSEHRGKGFAKAVVIKISKDCKDRGLKALGMVQKVNTFSMSVFQNIPGATQLPGTMITGIIQC